MKNSRYWINRAKKELLQTENMEARTIEQLVIIYDRANKYIREEIKKIFDKYADNGQLSHKQARAFLNLDETNEYYKKLEEQLLNTNKREKRYIETKLSARPYGARIGRLEALKTNIETEIFKFKGTEERITKDLYTNIIKKQYLATAFSNVDDKLINQLINHKWYGGNYSSRIWQNKDELKNSFDEIIKPSYIVGRPYVQIADEVSQRLNVELYKATRLVRTEGNYFHNQAILEGLEDIGIEEYKYKAVLDSRTSKICREKDGQIFKVKDAKVGENYPPLHPFCRSTAIMVIDKETRIARDMATGENYKTKAKTYEEYYNEQIEQHGEDRAKTEEKKVQNRSYDKKQFEVYRKILKDNPYMPKKVEDFLELKYNKDKLDEWNILKRSYYEEKNNRYLQEKLDFIEQFTREKLFIPKKTVFDRVGTIADSDKIYDIKRLLEMYGGEKKDWKKQYADIITAKYKYQIHFYQKDGKQFDVKYKTRKEL